MRVVTRNGKYIGEIVEYTGSGGITTNIRIGSFVSVVLPLIIIFDPDGSVMLNNPNGTPKNTIEQAVIY